MQSTFAFVHHMHSFPILRLSFSLNEWWQCAKVVFVIAVPDCVAVVTHMVTSEKLKIHCIYSTTLAAPAQ